METRKPCRAQDSLHYWFYRRTAMYSCYLGRLKTGDFIDSDSKLSLPETSGQKSKYAKLCAKRVDGALHQQM